MYTFAVDTEISASIDKAREPASEAKFVDTIDEAVILIAPVPMYAVFESALNLRVLLFAAVEKSRAS